MAQYLTQKDLELAESFSFLLGLVFGQNSSLIWVIAKVSAQGKGLHQLCLIENSTLRSPALESATRAVGDSCRINQDCVWLLNAGQNKDFCLC